MNTLSTRHRRTSGLPTLLPILAAILAFAPAAWADTDLATQPLSNLTVVAKPNLLFVLDASGSMAWSFMPDDMGDSSQTNDTPNDTWYGYYSSQCNGVAFDPSPTVKYLPPLKYDGTSYPNATFTAAWDDGYKGSSGSSTDLTNNFYYEYTGTQKTMGWTYTTAGHINSTFFQECSSTIPDGSTAGTPPGVNVFTKRPLSSATADLQQRYANWYSYYSHRYLLMRTAMGQAISALDDNFRVGFATIQDTTPRLGVSDFTAGATGQKQAFYSKLYGASPANSTPLPNALAMAGRYYANALTETDPVQYACQRNYTLMSTDGYWNDNSKDYDVNGSRVGEQDGNEVAPYKDGSGDVTSSVSTDNTATQTTSTKQASSKAQSRTITWTRTVNVTPSPGNGTGKQTTNCTAPGYYIVTKNATATEKQTLTYERVSTQTVGYTETVVTNAYGQVLSDTTSTDTPGPSSAFTYVIHVTDSNVSGDFSDVTPIDPGDGKYSGGTVLQCTNVKPATGTDSYPTPTAFGAGGSANFSGGSKTVTTGPYTAGTPQPAVAGTYGGISDTLADVAEYYYKTDLRTGCSSSGPDVCSNIVPPLTNDPATWQHMNTFTIGLGASGTLPYTKDYLTDTSATGTYPLLKAGKLDWPNPATSGQGNPANIDDLWHAAVNGRGQYYSALNSTQLAEGLASVVSQVAAVQGAGAAAATSSLQLVSGAANQVFKASYTTSLWTGDVESFTLDPTNATISTTHNWSAHEALDGIADKTTRTIYFSDGTTLQPFTYAKLKTASLNGNFDSFCTKTPAPSQCAGLSSDDQATANTGANLVNWLVGVNTYESAVANASTGINATASALYRKRTSVLGDIVDGAPVYVGPPPVQYGDAGYADFVSKNKSRTPVVYAAANDGMLHAFSAAASGGGTELWAYVPTMVMPNLYMLADKNYATLHQYYVDGAPVMGDVKDSSGNWHTIVVGGLNGGGKGYYALDITDPASPKLLWEFTNANLGYSFGNPVITKRSDKNGTWVVVFSSGYNNNKSGGDGNGHLFVLDALAGTKLVDLSTTNPSTNKPAGTTSTPSGLAKINAWVENATDNTSLRFYGGDLLGDLWRFDIDGLSLPNNAAQLLATFSDASSVAQPVTTRPETVAVGNRAVIIVGTGEYLGATDIASTSKQQETIYAVADDLTNTSWGDVRSNKKFVQQKFTLSSDSLSATVSDTAVDFTSSAIGGWWIDLPTKGERIFSNMSLQFNTLAIGTAIPNGDACSAGGTSWRYFLDVTNGGVITTGTAAGQQWAEKALIVGMSWVKDSSGNVRIIYQDSNGTIQSEIPPIVQTSGPGSAHRTSWRELTN